MPAEGRLQKAILSILYSHLSDLPLLQNRVLWEMALDSNGIQRTGKTFISTTTEIEEGQIKKSFEISFRRAVKSLEKSGKIIVTEKRITDLNEFLSQLPYIANKLEVFQLRINLLPTIKEFISDKKPSISDKNFDPFEHQLIILKNDHVNEYNKLLEDWKRIERDIIRLLENTEFERFDQWLDILSWGRYHFRNRRGKIILPPLPNSKEPYEKKVVKQIMDLIDHIKPLDDYKIGDTKKILYALFDAPRFGKIIVKDDLKHYLFEKKEELLKSLPGHEDHKGHANAYRLRIKKYSPLLDLLFSRHIFRRLSFLDTKLKTSK